MLGVPRPRCIRLNSDETFTKDSYSCGGVIRDSGGSFIRGFMCKLPHNNALECELWRLILGLQMARNMHLTSATVESDSLCLINKVKKTSYPTLASFTSGSGNSCAAT